MKRIAPIAALLVMVPILASAAPPGAPVTVKNTASNPVPVTGTVSVSHPELQAVQLSCQSSQCVADDLCVCSFPSIPSGKLLVIETISMKGFELALAPAPYANISTSVNDTYGNYVLPVIINVSTADSMEFSSLSSARLYADSTNSPPPTIYLTNIKGDTQVLGYISGYYLDRP